MLTLTVGAAAVPGSYNLYVGGYTTAGYSYTALRLMVTAP